MLCLMTPILIINMALSWNDWFNRPCIFHYLASFHVIAVSTSKPNFWKKISEPAYCKWKRVKKPGVVKCKDSSLHGLKQAKRALKPNWFVAKLESEGFLKTNSVLIASVRRAPHHKNQPYVKHCDRMFSFFILKHLTCAPWEEID